MHPQNATVILSNPPVVETVLGIQFADLARWSTVHHGLFFSRIRADFPKFRLMPEQPAIVESFPATPRGIRFGLTNQPGPDCAVFLNENETQLIRIQRNRFSYHWVGLPDGTYPHYSTNSQVCADLLEIFEQFCNDENVGTITPVLCEVVYVNEVAPEANQTVPGLIHEVFDANLGDFELATLNRTFVLGENQGRLYTEINSTDKADQRILQFKLTARVRHEKEDPLRTAHGAMDTLSCGHEWLIEHFLKLTNKRVRIEQWGSNE
ncbi:MAG: TIGR04255 family protein [Planctomycetales bacterium]|nr:TIGR04255 family protein [Planctomycetales bacterium]